MTAWGVPRRFLEAATGGDDCVIWPFSHDARGYGVIRVDGKMRKAHRESLLFHRGDPPADKPLACHGPCHTKDCINPDHLSWGNASSNAQDRGRDGSQLQGELFPVRKLRDCDVIEMRRLREEGVSCKDLAERFGVSRPLVSRICRRLKWAHLD